MQILNLSATLNVASLEPSINTYRLGEGAGTYEYPELNNKPQINGVTLVGNISSANLGIKTSDLTNDSGFISEADIPTATSDLTNDSGFVNATQVQSVVSDAIPSNISYFNNDVGYITDADIGNIPTRTSQLINDSGYITGAEAPVVSVNNMTGAVVLDGTNIKYEQNVSLNSKIDAVEADIPTATSELTNDSGFITNANIPTRTSQLVNDSGFVNRQNIPVQSVNGQTGEVKLTSNNIPYDSENSISEKIDENIQAIGDLSQLTTSVQSSLVGAVNELDSDKVDKTQLATSAFTNITPVTGVSIKVNKSHYITDKVVHLFVVFQTTVNITSSKLCDIPANNCYGMSFPIFCSDSQWRTYDTICYGYIGPLSITTTITTAKPYLCIDTIIVLS